MPDIPTKYREHITDTTDVLKKMLFRAKCDVARVLDFVATSPDIEGIAKEHQEQSLINLIALKVKRVLGEELSFSEQKKLTLSDRNGFAQNSALFQRLNFEIDEDLISLTKALNAKTYLFTVGSCAGHLVEEDNAALFNDTGFISVVVDSQNEEGEKIIASIRQLCESASNEKCEYAVKESVFSGGMPLYFISWSWKHPVYEKERELIQLNVKAETETERKSLNKQRDQLFEAKLELGPEAKKLGIHEEHMEFVGKLTELVESM